MAWDFETEPEFEEKLAWMRDFVVEEVFPLEVIGLPFEELMKLIEPLREQVKERGLYAVHLPPELGGKGLGQVKLGLMHEILGQSMYAPFVFGNNAPDSGNGELIAIGSAQTGRMDQRDQWLAPLLDGSARSAFAMTEP